MGVLPGMQGFDHKPKILVALGAALVAVGVTFALWHPRAPSPSPTSGLKSEGAQPDNQASVALNQEKPAAPASAAGTRRPASTPATTVSSVLVEVMDSDTAIAAHAWYKVLEILEDDEDEVVTHDELMSTIQAFSSKDESAREQTFKITRDELLSEEKPAEPRSQAMQLMALFANQTPLLRADAVFDQVRELNEQRSTGLLRCQIDQLSSQLASTTHDAAGSGDCAPITTLPPDPTCKPDKKSTGCADTEDWANVVTSTITLAAAMGGTVPSIPNANSEDR